MSSAALELHIPAAHYDQRRVLSDVRITLRAGERVALLGRSGAGKSTLLRLARQQLADQGRAPAWMPQDLGLVANLSAFHNVYSGRLDQHPWWRNLRNLVWPQRRYRAEITALLDELELGDALFRPAGELSGGQQQRLALARAAYRGGDLLLADEPLANLDAPLADRVLTRIDARFDGWLMALHDVPLALAHAGRVIGLRDGRVCLDRATAELSEAHIAELYAPV